MELLEKMNRAEGILVYEKSCVSTGEGEAVMILKDGFQFLAVTGALAEKFRGEVCDGYKLCPCDHENRLVLNEYFPWTKPVAMGRDTATFGYGDRMGFASAAQVQALADTPLLPVLAQQSLRELFLTGRTNTEVIDVAAWAVFREGYTKGFASDGDHLKSAEEIANALAEGCTMITLDCSLVLKPCSDEEAAAEGAFEALPEDVQANCLASYINSQDPAALGLSFTKATMVKLYTIYGEALKLLHHVYFDLLVPAGRPVDLEVSLDETEETTSPEAHYFVAVEMERQGIVANSVAPKFVGEFQKAIDYIGDLEELDKTMAVHAAIADKFGFKLSLHSGSEKYSVLPLLAKHTKGRYHVKTSGTSWLEVVETISKHAPDLYRKMHRVALLRLEDAKKHYVVHCDPARVKPLDEVADEDLPKYLELDQNDSRQLMHINYGFILEIPELKAEILQFLRDNRAAYEAEARELYGRHINLLLN